MESSEVLELGYPIGFMGDSQQYANTEDGVAYINNHVQIIIKYHKDPSYEGARVVGF
eukprot:GABW01000656.1.p2 GENE.GABW01000656.1~~GABW01000656.1.p2  ORF type:complete len:57 (-),score=10.10 GABW01000656.1:108-278(-)